MKQGKVPTKKQKIEIKKAGFVPENWLVNKNLPEVLHIVNRKSGKERKIRRVHS